MTFAESINLAIDEHSYQNLEINYNKNEKTIRLTCLNGLELENARLLDLNGATNYKWEKSLDGKNKHQLNVSKLINGIYILRIKTNYGIIAKKIIIH